MGSLEEKIPSGRAGAPNEGFYLHWGRAIQGTPRTGYARGMRVALGVAVVSFALAPAPGVAGGAERDLGGFFPGFESALVVRDVARGTTVRHGGARAAARVSPCSTFKIPNSLIGLETGVIRDASFVLPWDGVRRPREEWNRDHDLRSAIKYSVVWYYQELARRVGPERMQKWVSAFGYGNEDISGGIDRFWLGSSLRISPDEEVDFLGRLHAGTLTVSPRSLAIVKEILIQEAPGPGVVYRGKTGSCQDPGAPQPHGWWVGSVEKEGGLVLYAALIEGPGASGMVCRPMAERALAALGVLPAR
jgi:beta-lactamase class D